MKIKELVIVLIVGFLISSTMAFLIYSFYYVEYVKVYGMNITIGDRLGFDTDNKSLTFGMVPPGSQSSTRYIDIVNYENHPVRVDILKKGEMAPWVVFSENTFLLAPKSNQTLTVSAMIPSGIEMGNYTGKFKVMFKKNLFR